MKAIRIATRASRLALAQANQIRHRLSVLAPDIPVCLVEISTKGDRDRSDFLYQSSSVGFFTSEVENALLEGRADVAVHSLKDLPTAITDGLVIAAVPPREAVNDVLVTSGPIASIADLPAGAAVGTSSLRRISQLRLLRSDLDCRPLRGNVETRLRKVREGHLDAIVVAQAGLNRLGIGDYHGLALDPEQFIPAPGQGALAVQTRADDAALVALVGQLDDPAARLTAQTERRILAGLHGGCSIPLGVYSAIENETIHIHAILCNAAAMQCIRKTASCAVSAAGETADHMTQALLDDGGRELLDAIRREKEA